MAIVYLTINTVRVSISRQIAAEGAADPFFTSNLKYFFDLKNCFFDLPFLLHEYLAKTLS